MAVDRAGHEVPRALIADDAPSRSASAGNRIISPAAAWSRNHASQASQVASMRSGDCGSGWWRVSVRRQAGHGIPVS